MELRAMGKPDGPAVLLLPAPGAGAEELCRWLAPLAGAYRLLIPSPDADAETMERLLLHQGDSRLWGAWGLREGAALLLSVLERGRVDCRTAVLEGAFPLPAEVRGRYRGTLIFWKGGKDKKAKKTWQELKKSYPALRSLTLGKLKGKQDYLSVRPDLMAKRLLATFGTAVEIRVTDTLPGSADRLWRRLDRRPVGAVERTLEELSPIRVDDEAMERRMEGHSSRLTLWSRSVRLTPLGDNAAECSDRVELDAGKLNAVAAPLAKLYLRAEARARRKLLEKE